MNKQTTTLTGAMRASEELVERARQTTRPDFIERHILSAVRRVAGNPDLSAECKTRVALDRGTGRLTLGYKFTDGTIVFGKLYSDELGPHSARLLEELAQSGFGEGESYQVSQPLVYLPELNYLVTKCAAGVVLEDFIGAENPPSMENYIRESARWLVRLHQLPVRVGQPDNLWNSLKLFRIVNRITKASSRVPGERKAMVQMVHELCEAGKARVEVPPVQTHGRYHAEHVYVDDDTVTLIDFDRSKPGDPARDLAEFLSVYRLRTLKKTGSTDAAEMPTKVFLEEYLSQRPGSDANLAMYWGAYILLSMFALVKKQKHGDEEWERRLRFFKDEFGRVLAGQLVPA